MRSPGRSPRSELRRGLAQVGVDGTSAVIQDRLQHLDDTCARWEALLRLFEDMLPVKFTLKDIVERPDYAIPGLDCLLLTVRVASAGRSIMRLVHEEYDIDALVLARSQLEATVDLAWFLSGPLKKHGRRLIAKMEQPERESLLRVIADGKGSQDDLKRLQKLTHPALPVTPAPGVRTMAADADRYWRGKIPPFAEGDLSFRSLCYDLYAEGSMASHGNFEHLFVSLIDVAR